MMLEKKVMDILGQSNFASETVFLNPNGDYTVVIHEKNIPKDRGWMILFDGTTEGFIDGVYETACNFNIDDTVERYRNKVIRRGNQL